MSVDLLKQFQNNPRLFQLADRLSMSQSSAGAPSSQKIYLKNLRGSSPVFVNAAVFLHPACADLNHLVIVNDAEDYCIAARPVITDSELSQHAFL